MSYFDRLSFLPTVKAAAVAVFALGASVSTSDALTLELHDVIGGTTVFGTVVGDAASFNGPFAGFTLQISAAGQSTFPPAAGLALTNFITGGQGHVRVTATSSELFVPNVATGILNVGQDINPNQLPVTVGTLGGNVIMTLNTYLSVGGGGFMNVADLSHSNLLPLSQETNVVNRLVSLADPVQFRHVFEFRGAVTNKTLQSTASANIAPIPLPAAGWLLLGALGALGAAGARRRRKTENA